MHVAVCDFIIDCLQNSIEAGSGNIILDYMVDEDQIRTVITDNGKGMSSEQLAKVRDPFIQTVQSTKNERLVLGYLF